MDRLWAPWRAQYVRDPAPTQGPEDACFLCRGLAAEDDRTSLIVLRRSHTVVFLNRFPYNSGHLLVAPKSHLASLEELSGQDLVQPVETIQILIGVLARILRPHGYNVGLNLGRAAGAGVPGHLHWHIVPRWDGDNNFMPVVAGTKVLIESLDEFHLRCVTEISGMSISQSD